MINALCVLTFCVTLILFVVYWWKKRKARPAAGEDYKNDEQYKKISGHKSLIGMICILSFILIPFTTPQMTPEERAAYEAQKEQKKAKEEAEAKRLAEEKAAKEAELAQKDEEPGIWDRAKAFVGGVVDNEVHVCDGKLGSYYFLPSTKKRKDFGIIFKDEGYEIEVICKSPNGKVLLSKVFWFYEDSDGIVKFSTNGSKEWYRVRENYSELEESFDGQVGARVYEASKHFPNL